MSKLEKYLAKASEKVPRIEKTVIINGDEWKVRKLTLSENRVCERLADKGEKIDYYALNDARVVKSTEHDFPWNNPDLLKAYGVGTKYELPSRMFDEDPDSYAELLAAVREVNYGVSEKETVEELKNSSEPTENQATSVGHTSAEEENHATS